MKILIISPQVPLPLTDGGKKGIFGIMKYLSLRGHDIDFIAYLKDNDLKSSEDELNRYCKPFLLNVKTDNKISGALLNFFSPLPYNISKYHHREILKFLHKYFDQNNPDIIQIHNSHMAWLITYLRKLTDATIVLRLENIEMMIMKRFYETRKNPFIKLYSKIQYKKLVRYEPSICQKFDMCILVSTEDEKILKKFNPDVNCVTIQSGVESELLNHKPVATEKYSLVHIGNLNWLPNADSLQWFISDILPEIVRQNEKVKLYIYGGGNFEQIIIPDLIKKNIEYVGFVPDIWKAVENKSLLVIPLRVGSGIRIKILEMLAFGKNIISTSIGKEGIDIKDTEHIIIADDSNEFVSKIGLFFNDSYDNEKMIKNGKEFVRKNYLWEEIANSFEKVYFILISQNKK